MADTKRYNVSPEWNDEKSESIILEAGQATLPDGRRVSLRKLDGHPNLYQIQLDGQSQPIKAIVRSNSAGIVECSINGYTYSLKVYDAAFESLSAKLKEGSAATKLATKVVAPMPGLLKSIAVTSGQTVRKGEKLFVLEAMKMENVIKAPSPGVVRLGTISESSAVEKGVVLCTLDAVAPH